MIRYSDTDLNLTPTMPPSAQDVREHEQNQRFSYGGERSRVAAVMGELAQQGLKPREHSPNPAECVRLRLGAWRSELSH
jgi:hypothetical protein